MDEPVTLELAEATPGDLQFLRQMLYEAVCWRPDSDRPPIDELLSMPELAIILDSWGRDGDFGLVARMGNQRIGAASYRLWTNESHSYGFVDESTPEVGIALLEPWRGMGIGNRLLSALINHARHQGFRQLSLSVEKDNPAVILYRKLGFRLSTENEIDFVMICRLEPVY